MLSMDCYPIGDYCNLYPGLVYTEQMQLDDSPMWLDLTVARNLARKYGLPLWFYYQGCDVYHAPYLDFRMIRMMMYAGVLYGAKGLQNYTVTGACNIPTEGKSWPRKWTVLLGSGGKGEFFDDQKKIHAEFKNLGNTLLALENVGVFHSEDLRPFGKYGNIYENYREDIARSDLVSGPLPKRTSLGEFTDEFGNAYLLVLNRDFYRPLETALSLKGIFHIFEVSRDDGKQYLRQENTRSLPIALSGGDAVLLRLQPAGKAPFTVGYRL